jgi:hypothetical protein
MDKIAIAVVEYQIVNEKKLERIVVPGEVDNSWTKGMTLCVT